MGDQHESKDLGLPALDRAENQIVWEKKGSTDEIHALNF